MVIDNSLQRMPHYKLIQSGLDGLPYIQLITEVAASEVLLELDDGHLSHKR